jgi:putative heme-binding domain-containing protein
MLLAVLSRSASEETRDGIAAFIAGRLKSGWSPPSAVIEEVLTLFPEESEARRELFDAWERNNAAKLARLREFKSLLAGGDAGRGREWFTMATCAGCHRAGAYGGEFGPDLTKIGAIRSGEDLLESILYPSSTFAQGYEPYRLTRGDGEEFFGSVVEQGPEGVKFRDAAGMVHHFPVSEVVALEPHPVSAMPAGLEQLLTREQFRDLMGYLQSLR